MQRSAGGMRVACMRPACIRRGVRRACGAREERHCATCACMHALTPVRHHHHHHHHTVVELYSSWCGICKSVQPTFRRIRLDKDDEAALTFLTVRARPRCLREVCYACA